MSLKKKSKANLFRLLIDHYPIRKNIMKCNLQRFESLMMNILLTLFLEPLIFNFKSELNKNRDEDSYLRR